MVVHVAADDKAACSNRAGSYSSRIENARIV